jgi:signal transduction histidine kinase/HPt (histidine-containing phosphotransfer) domain-containing protein
MKMNSSVRIVITAALSFLIVFFIIAIVFSIAVKQADDKNAVLTTKLYAELARSGGLGNKHITSYILSENGTVTESGISLVSLLIDRVSIQTAEKISEFIYNPSGFYSYSTGSSYIGILPFTEGGERYFVFVDVPAEFLPEVPKAGLFLYIILFISAAGLFLLIIAVFLAAKKSINHEKDLTAAVCKKDIEDLKHRHALSLRASEERFEAENVRAASDMHSAFFGRISHEIRTPMNSILGIAQIMLADSKLPEAQTKYMNDIKSSADLLLNTVNDILDLSRLSTGKMPLYLHDYNFIQLVDNISAYARFTAKQRNLEYNFCVPEKLPQCLYGDSARLKQLLTNIINNAVKFTKKGSISLKVVAGENELSFEVQDTGTGIAPEQFKTLFDPFSTALKTGMGAGLGLTISKSLAHLMDGDITVSSEYGAGSTFTVIIPKIMGDGSKLQSVTMKANLRFTSNTRILVVDDNEINLNVASGLVSSLYCIKCDSAGSGSEALSFIEEHDYDLIFMDHIMPEPDGIQTTKLIREKGGKYADIPIIALTANTVAGVVDVLTEAGMNDVLVKPIVIEEMSNILQKWLPADKCEPVTDNQSSSPDDDLLGFMEKGGRIITAAMNITELDVNAGLSSVAFKEDVYESSLKLLAGKIPKIIAVLEECFENNKLSEFALHVHGMKGSLAAVGAVSLSMMAAALENAGKNNNYEACRKTFPEFTDSLQKLEGQLSSLFADNAETPARKKAGTRKLLDKNLATLKEAVENYNYELLIDTVTDMTEHDFGFEINSDIFKIKILADNFDYDGIIQAIRELKYELIQ